MLPKIYESKNNYKLVNINEISKDSRETNNVDYFEFPMKSTHTHEFDTPLNR